MTLTDLLPILLAAYEEHGDLPLATGFDDHRQILGVLISPIENCLLYTSPSPRDRQKSRMPSSA